MIAYKKEFRQLISFFFASIFLFSCKKDICPEKDTGNIEEFVNYSINAANYAYTAPVDAVGVINPVLGEFSSYFIESLRVNSTGQADGNYSVLSFNLTNIGLNSNQPLKMFGTTNVFGINNFLVPLNPVDVHITEYGQVGEFIAGDFTGTLNEVQNQNNHYNIVCSFRVKRTQ